MTSEEDNCEDMIFKGPEYSGIVHAYKYFYCIFSRSDFAKSDFSNLNFIE